ncbi:MAG: J domain-containing protein [Flavobacteriales bacterium]|nr:J domain-containing protein [Flavobacteriales bacterium]
MKTLTQQYQLLGLLPGAGEDEVRQAYRTLAKRYHPDVSTESNAREKFVEIHMAYEAVMRDLKQPRETIINKIVNPFQGADIHQAARRRAEAFGRKRYEEYLNSEEFQEDENYLAVSRFMGFVFTVATLVVVPLLFYYFTGNFRFIPAIVAIFLLFSPVFFPFLRDISKVEWPRLKTGWKDYAIQSTIFHFIFLLGNLVCFAVLASHVFVPLWLLLTLFLGVSIALTIHLRHRYREIYIKSFVGLGLTLFVMNALMMINSAYTYNPVAESYRFRTWEYQYTSSRHSYRYPYNQNDEPQVNVETEPVVLLENDKYKFYPQIRLFANIDTIRGDVVTFHIADGLLGFRVLKGYEFSIAE